MSNIIYNPLLVFRLKLVLIGLHVMSSWAVLSANPHHVSRTLPATAAVSVQWNLLPSPAPWPTASPWKTWIDSTFVLTAPWDTTKCFHAWFSAGLPIPSPITFDAQCKYVLCVYVFVCMCVCVRMRARMSMGVSSAGSIPGFVRYLNFFRYSILDTCVVCLILT